MTASTRSAWLAVIAALALCAGEARAARTLLADLLARPAASDDTKATLTPQRLAACMRQARELDKIGLALDGEISEIERITAEAMFLQFAINAQFPRLEGDDKEAVAEFDQRTRRHAELSGKFQTDYPVYRKRKANYDEAVSGFEQNCAGSFRGQDLDVVKTKLQLK
jgi:hypothetical protein